MCERLAQGHYLAVHRVGLKPSTSGLQVRHATIRPPSHRYLGIIGGHEVAEIAGRNADVNLMPVSHSS